MFGKEARHLFDGGLNCMYTIAVGPALLLAINGPVKP
jgi:hypothetical protein